ncbi:MAG: hypothetical protein OWR52_09960 [Acidibacillus sp.]|nr:hypothetical protein [Acidibacillus sp.]
MLPNCTVVNDLFRSMDQYFDVTILRMASSKEREFVIVHPKG